MEQLQLEWLDGQPAELGQRELQLQQDSLQAGGGEQAQLSGACADEELPHLPHPTVIQGCAGQKGKRNNASQPGYLWVASLPIVRGYTGNKYLCLPKEKNIVWLSCFVFLLAVLLALDTWYGHLVCALTSCLAQWTNLSLCSGFCLVLVIESSPLADSLEPLLGLRGDVWVARDCIFGLRQLSKDVWVG